MILQALATYYEAMLERETISAPGWGRAKVSYGLALSQEGEILALIPYQQEEQRGKKTVLAARILTVPMPAKRTVGIDANFLCDHSGYLLGVDSKGKPKRTHNCFEACKALHQKLLTDVDSPAAHAVLAFFERWNPAEAANHPVLADQWEEVISGLNLIFCYQMAPASQDFAIKRAWQQHYDALGEDAPQGQCLVTGEAGPIALIHPSIKGIRNAQSSGASLVSFNSPAFCSYGREQGFNAPVGSYASFAYTTALNALIADSEHRTTIGDATVVCWAEHGDPAYQDAGIMAMYGGGDTISDAELRSMLEKLSKGDPFDWRQSTLDPKEHFYMLGISPNAARLSIRFFYQDHFGSFAKKMRQHYEDIEIPRPPFDRYDLIPLWRLLGETVNQNAQEKSASPSLTGDVLRAILSGAPYPATLINAVALRIRAEHEVTRGRAAIIKGYYRRFHHRLGHPHCPEEVLQVGLNEKSTNIPYTLGRLFSIFEQIQRAANPSINATIKDKYFNSAASTPSTIFSVLGNLSQKHLRKLTDGQRGYFNTCIGELSLIIGEAYPTRLDLPQQGAFQLGYYFQDQKRFEKKEEKKED